jgi:Domain of unknown function (DUF1906)
LSTSIGRLRPPSRHRTSTGLVALFVLGFVALGPNTASAGTSNNSETIGFDCSYTKPDPGAMAGAGYGFAIGYLSHTPAKNISAAQVSAYRKAGIDVGLVWETTAGRALDGRAAGDQDGHAAEAQADALNYPADAVIFFAVDKDTSWADRPAIRAYAEGFARATHRPVGIFGEADVLDNFVTPGRSPVQYGWQTAAWSAGRVSAKADLYKRIGHPSRPVPAGISPKAFDEVVEISRVPLAR